MPASGVQGAKETNGEQVHSVSVKQNNVATVFSSGFSGLVTSSQTMNTFESGTCELAEPPSLGFQFSQTILPSPRSLAAPFLPSQQSQFITV